MLSRLAAEKFHTAPTRPELSGKVSQAIHSLMENGVPHFSQHNVILLLEAEPLNRSFKSEVATEILRFFHRGLGCSGYKVASVIEDGPSNYPVCNIFVRRRK